MYWYCILIFMNFKVINKLTIARNSRSLKCFIPTHVWNVRDFYLVKISSWKKPRQIRTLKHRMSRFCVSRRLNPPARCSRQCGRCAMHFNIKYRWWWMNGQFFSRVLRCQSPAFRLVGQIRHLLHLLVKCAKVRVFCDNYDVGKETRRLC